MAHPPKVLFVGGSLIMDTQLTVGEFVALSTYIGLLSWPTASLAWIINIIQRGKAAWLRIEAILDVQSEFVGTQLISASADLFPLRFSNLSFSYSDTQNPVLNNINLSINQGQIIGIFGSSGSGKTTLVRLLAGLEKVENHQFFIDDQCMNQFHIDRYRDHHFLLLVVAPFPQQFVFAQFV